MRFVHSFVMALVLFTVTAQSARAVCGSKGGPAFRGPNGRYVGLAELASVCGTPPTTRCSYEGGGIGDTGPKEPRRCARCA